jgi:hypothetical protein
VSSIFSRSENSLDTSGSVERPEAVVDDAGGDRGESLAGGKGNRPEAAAEVVVEEGCSSEVVVAGAAGANKVRMLFVSVRKEERKRDFAGKQREFMLVWAGAGPGLIAPQRMSGRLQAAVR